MNRQPVTPGYEPLAEVLDQALWQAQYGKGKDRHASGEPFVDQQIVKICEDLGSPQFAIGQARKKSRESLRLDHGHARRELLGAINYLAAAVIVLERAQLAHPHSSDAPGYDATPSDPLIACPVDSNECRIRNRCTNKCGRLDASPRLLDGEALESGPRGRGVL
jgi:hypothetical protein